MKNLDHVSDGREKVNKLSNMRFLFLDGGVDIDPPARIRVKENPKKYYNFFDLLSCTLAGLTAGVCIGVSYVNHLTARTAWVVKLENNLGYVMLAMVAFAVPVIFYLERKKR